jgi:hypothetical protein
MISSSSGQSTPILAGSPQKQQQRPSFFSSPQKSVMQSPTRGMLMGDVEHRKGEDRICKRVMCPPTCVLIYYDDNMQVQEARDGPWQTG